MKTLVFTAKKLLDILSTLEGIEDGDLFRSYMFKIIHCEVMKASYRNLRHVEQAYSSGSDILVEELAMAGRQAQDKMLAFCCALDDSGKTIRYLLHDLKNLRGKLGQIERQKQNLSYWKLSDYRQRYEFHKQKKSLLQQTYSFVDIGNLFLHLYKQRQLGNIVDFKYCLMRYSRKRTNTPVVRAVPVWKFKSSLHHEQ